MPKVFPSSYETLEHTSTTALYLSRQNLHAEQGGAGAGERQ